MTRLVTARALASAAVVSAAVIAVGVSATPASAADPPFPIVRLPAVEESYATDISATGDRALIIGGTTTVVTDRVSGNAITITMIDPIGLSGDGRFVVGVRHGVVQRERVGSQSPRPVHDAIPEADGWRAVYVDADSTGTVLAIGAFNETEQRGAVFVYDLVTSMRYQVAASLPGDTRSSEMPSISGDGRFTSYVTTKRIANPEGTQVYVFDRVRGTDTMVSRNRTGGPGRYASRSARISADGRSVVFTSFADDLVAGTKGPQPRYFLRDLATRTTRLIGAADDWGYRPSTPSLTADGSRVAFIRAGKTQGGTDVTSRLQVFIWADGDTQQVSWDRNGGAPNGVATMPMMSDDGTALAFASLATDLTGSGKTGTFVAELPAP